VLSLVREEVTALAGEQAVLEVYRRDPDGNVRLWSVRGGAFTPTPGARAYLDATLKQEGVRGGLARVKH
jgi:hypothetical protein